MGRDVMALVVEKQRYRAGYPDRRETKFRHGTPLLPLCCAVLSLGLLSCSAPVVQPTTPTVALAQSGEYRGHAYQPNLVAFPDVSFTLSPDGRSITAFRTSPAPGASLYPDCGGAGFSVAGNHFGFPSPHIVVQPDGSFSGRITSSGNTSVISGSFNPNRSLADGTIYLFGLPPTDVGCPVRATFTVGRASNCADAAGPGDKVTRWRPVVQCALSLLSQSPDATNVEAMLSAIRHESAGDPRTLSGPPADYSVGLTQISKTLFLQFADPALALDAFDPLANVYAALNLTIAEHLPVSAVAQVMSRLLVGAPCADAPGVGDMVTRWTPVVRCALALHNESQDNRYVNLVLALIRHSSGGDPHLIGSFNGRGLAQITEAVFLKNADPRLTPDITDPLANISAALILTLNSNKDLSQIEGLLTLATVTPTPCADAPGQGDMVTRWAPVVRCALSLANQAQDATNVDAVVALIRKESGGDPLAVNLIPIPGISTGGLTQMRTDLFMQFAAPGLSSNIIDPLANIYAALNSQIAHHRPIAVIATTF